MDQFAKLEALLTQEWEIVQSVPNSFVAAVVVCAALIWSAMQWAHAARIRNLRETIRLQEARIDLVVSRFRDTKRQALEPRSGLESLQSRLDQVPVASLNLKDTIETCSAYASLAVSKVSEPKRSLEETMYRQARTCQIALTDHTAIPRILSRSNRPAGPQPFVQEEAFGRNSS